MTASLAERLDEIEAHMRGEGLRGYDPYDALCSPMFRLPVLRDNRILRFGAQQVVKRLPINVRPMLRIPKQLNPVTVGLFLQGLAHRAEADSARASARTEAVELVAELERLISPGWSGACWGYPFDWEARYASLPAGTPTIVATGMVTNALAVADDVFDLPEARALIVSATRFVLDDLHRTPGPGNSLCWSYSPLDHQVVLNATLKGSRLLAQAHARGADRDAFCWHSSRTAASATTPTESCITPRDRGPPQRSSVAASDQTGAATARPAISAASAMRRS